MMGSQAIPAQTGCRGGGALSLAVVTGPHARTIAGYAILCGAGRHLPAAGHCTLDMAQSWRGNTELPPSLLTATIQSGPHSSIMSLYAFSILEYKPILML